MLNSRQQLYSSLRRIQAVSVLMKNTSKGDEQLDGELCWIHATLGDLFHESAEKAMVALEDLPHETKA